VTSVHISANDTIFDSQSLLRPLFMSKSGDISGPPPKGRPDQDNDSISIALRRLHKTVVDESIPDDFLNLLAEIDRKIDVEKGVK
jgi:Anti-sigma factor NepR